MKIIFGFFLGILVCVGSAFSAAPEDVAEEKKLSAMYLQKMTEEASSN